MTSNCNESDQPGNQRTPVAVKRLAQMAVQNVPRNADVGDCVEINIAVHQRPEPQDLKDAVEPCQPENDEGKKSGFFIGGSSCLRGVLRLGINILSERGRVHGSGSFAAIACSREC